MSTRSSLRRPRNPQHVPARRGSDDRADRLRLPRTFDRSCAPYCNDLVAPNEARWFAARLLRPTANIGSDLNGAGEMLRRQPKGVRVARGQETSVRWQRAGHPLTTRDRRAPDIGLA
jgi:hypothetical protein